MRIRTRSLASGHHHLNFDQAIKILRKDPSLITKYANSIFFLGLLEKKMTPEILDTFYASINFSFKTLHMGHLPPNWDWNYQFSATGHLIVNIIEGVVALIHSDEERSTLQRALGRLS